eukprot:TRINITY_DN74908_c0_g1_i1.p1 TRINITY_DN74908_c0_g1~~TRINITY_DN74908_c0_g1_i1.p1  ORF type:complete len:548 (-),score=72.38 TRINITY_DN74908_c0_g1_i1:442-2085(-)
MVLSIAIRLLLLQASRWWHAVANLHAPSEPSLPRPPPGGLISTDPESGVLIDEDGRQRIFHGTNVVYKGYPYAPPMIPIDTNTSFGEADMDRLAEWGMNNVRLGLTWAGAEPRKGEFNFTYLAALRSIVDELGKRGIYTYVELHQDALAERFCGNGMPTWAIDPHIAQSFPQPVLGTVTYPVNETDGLPSEADCQRTLWANYYGTKAVGAIFQNIYDNTGGLGDHLVLLWKHVASTFKNCTWLLGYEIMNEPWAGDHWQHPDILLPGVADRKNLARFYEWMASSIQYEDEHHLIMWEPLPWDNFVPAGFTETPLGVNNANKSVFAYHYYHPPDMMSPSKYMDYRTKDARRLLSAGFLTEFATSWNVPDSTAPQHDLQHTEEIIAAAENFTLSWSGWQYKVFHPSSGRHPMTPGDMSMFHPDGTLDVRVVSAVSQPYARAVGGNIRYNKFTPAKHSSWPFDSRSSYVLEYFAFKTCKLPTEVYVHEAHFPGGIAMTVSPFDAAEVLYNRTARVVHVTHTAAIADLTLVTLRIESKRSSNVQVLQSTMV